MRALLACLGVVALIACRRPQGTLHPPVVIESRGCGLIPGEVPELRIRSWSALADTDSVPGLGDLRVHVRSAGPNHPPLALATIAIHRDTTGVHEDAPMRRGQTDDDGQLHLRSLPLGVYGLVARRIGSVPLKGMVRVRAGYSATVEITLANERLC